MSKVLTDATLQALKNSYLPERFVNKIIEDCQCIFDKSIEDLLYIVLFGSCARGNLDINSDVDLLIITKSMIDREIKIDLDHELDEEKDGVSTDVVFYDLETYLRSEGLLVKEIKKYGKILWEVPTDDRK